MQLSVGPCERQHVLGLCLLNLATFPPTIKPGGGLRVPGATLASDWYAMQRRLAVNHVLVATQPDGGVVGSVEIHTAAYLKSQAPELTPAQASQLQPYLASMAVRPNLRGRGLGRRLVDAALAEAAVGAGPGEAVLLRVEADNSAAVALYRGAGFDVVSAPGCQIILMRKRLLETSGRGGRVARAAAGGAPAAGQPPSARASWLDAPPEPPGQVSGDGVGPSGPT